MDLIAVMTFISQLAVVVVLTTIGSTTVMALMPVMAFMAAMAILTVMAIMAVMTIIATRIESKVFSLERPYPSYLVEVSKSEKYWVQRNFSACNEFRV